MAENACSNTYSLAPGESAAPSMLQAGGELLFRDRRLIFTCPIGTTRKVRRRMTRRSPKISFAPLSARSATISNSPAQSQAPTIFPHPRASRSEANPPHCPKPRMLNAGGLIGVGTYHLSTGLKQHKPASLATVADPALSLTEERDHDRRLVAENTGTQHQPQASPAAQSRLLNPTADDLSSSATKDHPFVMALPESQDGPVSPSTEGTSPKPPLSRSAPELAPPQDAKLEPTLRTQSTAETNPPAAPIVATAQLAEADPVLAAATVPIETKLPALIEARQPGFSAPKQDTQCRQSRRHRRRYTGWENLRPLFPPARRGSRHPRRQRQGHLLVSPGRR